MEHIIAENSHWVCLCGNEPHIDGFYPCDSEGESVEPTPEEWTTNCYVCERCGRIIDQSALAVVGMRRDKALAGDEEE